MNEALTIEQAASLARIIRSQVSRAVVGQDDAVTSVIAAFLAGGHVLLEGLPGRGKTLLVLALSRALGGALRAHPVHARSHAQRRDRPRDARPGDPALHDPPRPRVHPLPAGRRDQPGARQDPGRPARGDAGGPGDHRGADLPARPALHDAGDPEPGGAGGHLLLARGSAGPLPAQGGHRLPGAGGRGRHRAPRDGGQDRPEARCLRCRGGHRPGGSGGPAAVHGDRDRRRAGDRLRRPHRASDAHLEGVSFGAGPRGAISLIRAARAMALLEGRAFVIPDDVKEATLPALRHRVAVAPDLEIEGLSVDEVLAGILGSVEAPRQ